jgi:hypothetical protein
MLERGVPPEAVGLRSLGHLVLPSLADVQVRHDHKKQGQNAGSYGGP